MMVDSINAFCWNPDIAPGRLLPWFFESPPSSVALGTVVVMGLLLVVVVHVLLSSSQHRWISLRQASTYGNYQKRQVYKQWIARAHREREERLHRVLSLVVVESDDTIDDEISNNHRTAPEQDWRTAGELWAAVQGGTTTPAALVVRAARQCRRAREAYNCVAEELYDEAWEWAHQELPLLLRPSSAKNCKEPHDNDTKHQQQQEKFEWPLLYGVPISVKECHAVKGCYSTGGLACRLNERCRHDCLMVQLARDAGALIVATGNVPQIMMLPCCENFIWGQTVNPYNTKRVPGGSSGGDAVLVATGAVPLAIGSDVAGSLRIPAAFCGIAAFKPTPGRCSYQGCMTPRFNNRPAATTALLPVVMGPMARSVDDCATYMKVTLVPKLWETDRLLPPLPFDRDQYEPRATNTSSKSTCLLKLAYFDDDGWFEPCATSKRAVHETVQKLRQEGHLVERFELPTDGWYNYGLLVAINAAEGNMKSYVDALEGEPMIDDYTLLRRASNLPNWLRPMAAALLDERRAHLFRQTVSGGLSARELLEKMVQLVEVRRQWASALRPYDAVIFPALPVPALPHGVAGELTAVCSYIFLGNLLQWPAGVVPVTTVQLHEVPYDVSQLPRNQQDYIARTVADLVCNADSVGLPMGVSVMSTAFRDETCLRVMREVERVVQFTTHPPPPPQEAIPKAL